MSNLTAVIIDSDAAQAASLKKHLESEGWVIAGEARNLAAGHELVSEAAPNLIIIELETNIQASFGFIERISQENPAVSIIATSANSSSENILRAIKSGCSEFLVRPVMQEDLAQALRKVQRLFLGKVPGCHQVGKVITCFSPKGGCGCTTFAVNIAAALSVKGKEVLLADLDLSGGCADVFLNLRPKYSVADAVNNIDKLDQSFLQGVVARHSSGISLLSSPGSVRERVKLDRPQLAFVVEQLKKMFQFVVIDMGRCYNEVDVWALKSDLLLIVGELTLPSIGNIQKALVFFSELGFSEDATKLIINRFNRNGRINITAAEKALGKNVSWRLPNFYDEFENAVSKGQPLVTLFPNSVAAKVFTDVATTIDEMIPRPAAAYCRGIDVTFESQ